MIQIFKFLINYTLFISVCIILYKILIEKNVQPSQCRRVLLDMLWFSWILVPMCKVVEMGYLSINPREETVKILLMIYGGGAMVFFIIFCINVVKLSKIKRHSTPSYIDNTEVYLHDREELGCFSWSRRIFLPKPYIHRNREELSMILAHEHAHIYLFHWLDLIVANILIIGQWFNPFMWYLKGELQRIHECEADRKVVSDNYIDKLRYEKFLIQESSHPQLRGMMHGLSFSSLKYRLIMLNKADLKKNIAEKGSLIFAIATSILIFL